MDFIDVRCIDFYVFNVADSFVCIGCAMFFVWVLRTEILEKKNATSPDDTAKSTDSTAESTDSTAESTKEDEA